VINHIEEKVAYAALFFFLTTWAAHSNPGISSRLFGIHASEITAHRKMAHCPDLRT
jgi:hypothetical protein